MLFIRLCRHKLFGRSRLILYIVEGGFFFLSLHLLIGLYVYIWLVSYVVIVFAIVLVLILFSARFLVAFFPSSGIELYNTKDK